MQPLTMVAQKMTKLLLIVSNMKLLQFSFLFNNENLIFLGKFVFVGKIMPALNLMIQEAVK